jgi:REP element-mobilizing transposase RayT
LWNERGDFYSLAEITKGIKGSSAPRINQLLGRHGIVWQDEPWDHELRRDESLAEKIDYVCLNPVRAGLAATPDEYPWLWREWVEGRAGFAGLTGWRTRPK